MMTAEQAEDWIVELELRQEEIIAAMRDPDSLAADPELTSMAENSFQTAITFLRLAVKKPWQEQS